MTNVGKVLGFWIRKGLAEWRVFGDGSVCRSNIGRIRMYGCDDGKRGEKVLVLSIRFVSHYQNSMYKV